jgi:hypothetical protein
MQLIQFHVIILFPFLYLTFILKNHHSIFSEHYFTQVLSRLHDFYAFIQALFKDFLIFVNILAIHS